MSGDASNPNSARWGRYLFIVGLVLLTALGWHFGFGRLAALVGGARPGPLLAMAGLILAGFWIRAWKWRYALGAGNQGVLLFFLAKTAGNWTPGRAGELAPLLLQRHRNTRVAAWIGLDRVVEIGWTLGLGLLGAVAVQAVSPAVAIALVVLGSLFVGAIGFLWSRAAGSDATAHSEERQAGWRGHLLGFARQLRRELVLFGGKLPFVMMLTALAKVTDVVAVILLCEAFGYGASFLLVCAARCAHGLVSAIPVTPDATGVPFVAAAWLLHAHAEIPYDTLTAALGLEVLAINAILWACFCLVSGLRWNSTPNGSHSP